MNRRDAAIVLAGLTVGVLPAAFAEGTWPDRPIKLVVPYPPGGVSDALARQVGRTLEKELGQPIVIDNRPGAGSNIGSDQVAKAAPDGYTILLGSSANSVNMSLFRKLSYDTVRDFAPVSLLANVPNVLVVNSKFPAQTVADIVAYAKQHPDELAYASAGPGSPAHLAAEQFNRLAGVRIRHVPYKGAAPAVSDVMAGQVPIIFTNIAAVQPGLQAGHLRLVAVGAKTRWPGYPNTPTIAEAGVAGYDASAWYGLMVPAGTPPAVIARIGKALDAVRTPASMEAMRKLGVEPVISTPAALKEHIEQEIKAYAKLVKETGITPE